MKKIVCPVCGGKKLIDDPEGKIFYDWVDPDVTRRIKITCPKCKGKGYIEDGRN